MVLAEIERRGGGPGVQMGPFLIDADGRLTLREAGLQPAFGFDWRGRAVSARLCEGGLLVSASLGRVPSTADDAASRDGVFTTLHGLAGCLPSGWVLRLLPDHRVQLDAEQALAMPVTASELLTPLTCFLLSLAPYLDLLEEAGVGTRRART